jgi:mono/diheme cytochrome c family protein
MSARIAVCALAFALGASLTVISAAERPVNRSADRGRDIALNICSACHVVASGQQRMPILDPPAASLLDVANRPETKPAGLRHFVATTHWDEKTVPVTMPNPALTEEQIADVVQYIMSLRHP